MIKFLMIALGFSVFSAAMEEPYARILRINCTTSGVGTCANPYCNLKLASRYKSYLNAGCEKLSRPLTKVIGEYTMSYKRIGNYYQILHVKPTNICEFLSFFFGKANNPLLNLLVEVFSDRVHLCPYKDKDLQVYNLTVSQATTLGGPDGYYKSSATFKDDKDDNIYSATWVLKITNKHDIVQFK